MSPSLPLAEVSGARRGLAEAVVLLVLFNAMLAFGNDWPGLGIRAQALVSVELCLGASLVLVWVRCRGRPWPGVVAGLAGLLTLMVVARYLDVTGPALFGRPLNLYWDGRHAWQLLRMMAADLPGWRVAAGALGGLLALALLFALLHWMTKRLVRSFETCACWRWLLAAGLATVALHALQPWAGVDRGAGFATPVTVAVSRAALQLHDALSPRSAERLGTGPGFAGNLAALDRSDVLLVFAEAYGAVTLDDDEIAPALSAARVRLADEVKASGRAIVSARVRSPTFGGGSWLAHAALLAGIDTADAGDYDLLLTTDRPTLVSHFGRNGYRTVAWMPGLQRPWPEGRFYGFDRYADVDSIGYSGLAFGYWRIPDQAALALLHNQELGSARSIAGPRFVVFPTVSSHAPFRPLAPYVEDWSALLSPDAYSAAELGVALDEPVSWTRPRPAYLQAMRYTFAWLGGYLREHAPADLLTIVIGDHQPVAGVSGRDASWEVPVHVIGADRRLLSRFEAAGFRPGAGEDAVLLGDMHELTAVLLEVFGAATTP